MITFNDYCKKTFGEKLYKISLDAGFTCPNRDGTLGTRGCIFCSAGGSGDFAEKISISVDDQIERAKNQVSKKYKGSRYIAYFQAYTNTYAPVDHLRTLFYSVINRSDIAALSIATRPDCLPDDVLDLLSELNQIKPVIVELGLQTVHEKTAQYIRRGYSLSVYDETIQKLNARNIHTVTHVILGLPGETYEQMAETVKHVVHMKSAGIKLQLLHVLKGTDLAADYAAGKFEVMTMDEYMNLLSTLLPLLPQDMVVHRLTGDGPKRLLIAPLWTGDKKRVMNEINALLNKIS